MAKQLYARYFARHGEWGPGLFLILQGDPIPADLVEAGERLRRIWKRVELEKELRDELDPPKKKTVTWVNDSGEVVTVHGYEERGYEAGEEEEV